MFSRAESSRRFLYPLSFVFEGNNAYHSIIMLPEFHVVVLLCSFLYSFSRPDTNPDMSWRADSSCINCLTFAGDLLLW